MVVSADLMSELTALFKAGLKGDTRAYADFLHRLTPLLRRVIGRKISGSEAEDVLQEVLISLHKARHTYDGERPLLPWVMAITSFRVTDHLRKCYSDRRHRTVDIADYENLLEAVTETPGESESIDMLLEGVGVRERNILSLMHVEGFTAKEVGMKLGMKESAVKVAAHRAIKKLRGQLGHG